MDSLANERRYKKIFIIKQDINIMLSIYMFLFSRMPFQTIPSGDYIRIYVLYGIFSLHSSYTIRKLSTGPYIRDIRTIP